MPQLSKRTDAFTDSVIRRMTRISLQYGAVNLSQGFPDFDPPRAILDRLTEVANEDFHQYSITWGHKIFGKRWLLSSPASWATPSILTARSWSPAAVPRP